MSHKVIIKEKGVEIGEYDFRNDWRPGLRLSKGYQDLITNEVEELKNQGIRTANISMVFEKILKQYFDNK